MMTTLKEKTKTKMKTVKTKVNEALFPKQPPAYVLSLPEESQDKTRYGFYNIKLDDVDWIQVEPKKKLSSVEVGIGNSSYRIDKKHLKHLIIGDTFYLLKGLDTTHFGTRYYSDVYIRRSRFRKADHFFNGEDHYIKILFFHQRTMVTSL